MKVFRLFHAMSWLFLSALLVSCVGPGKVGKTPAAVPIQNELPGDSEVVASDDEVASPFASPSLDLCDDQRKACAGAIEKARYTCENACASDYPDEAGRQSCNTECAMGQEAGVEDCDRESNACMDGLRPKD